VAAAAHEPLAAAGTFASRWLARLLQHCLHVCWPLAAAARVRGVSALDHLASCATATSHTAGC